MIYTSYFGNLDKLKENNIFPISICGKAPNDYFGAQYKKLAPKWTFFKVWKETHNNDYYTKHFNEEVLSKLNVKSVLEDFYNLFPPDIKNKIVDKDNWYNSKEINIALICYEKPQDFCHRHLVEKWFKESGILVKEY